MKGGTSSDLVRNEMEHYRRKVRLENNGQLRVKRSSIKITKRSEDWKARQVSTATEGPNPIVIEEVNYGSLSCNKKGMTLKGKVEDLTTSSHYPFTN